MVGGIGEGWGKVARMHGKYEQDIGWSRDISETAQEGLAFRLHFKEELRLDFIVHMLFR